MKFWNREKEIKWLKRYLQTEPNALLFIYGPKSSGKSTLLQKAIADEKIDAFYYDLRMIPVSSYKDVLSIFFRERGWKERIKGAIPGIASALSKYFEVDSRILKDILELKLNPFEIMEDVLRGRRKRKKKHSLIVFDELQKLKEVYLNSPNNQKPLINELFNFFVRLTKVLHLSHVVIMTSDTFFIERIYGDSSLKHTSRFYLVDFFDDDTALRILLNEGLSREEAEYVVGMAGGIPWVLEEVLEGENPKEVIEDLYRQEKGQLRELLGRVVNRELREKLMGILRGLLEGRRPDMLGEERKYVEKLVDMEILFYDPIKGEVRFQSKLDERAAREILKNQFQPQL